MKARLSEAWKRYHMPVVATEVHLGCTREDQVRWLLEAWNAAQELRADGQDIRAITVWALLGSMDWSSLLVSRREHYESGAFDVRSGRPRRTAVANAARSLAKRGSYSHPVLNGAGWWRRNDRYFDDRSGANQTECANGPRILIAASNECAFASMFADICRARGLPCSLLSWPDDIDPTHVAEQIADMQAWALINLDAPLMRLAPDSRDGSFRCSVARAKHLAHACAVARIPLVHVSSHLVFDGKIGGPYTENDLVAPDCATSCELIAAERAVLGRCADCLVVRAGPLFGLVDDNAASFEGGNEPASLVSPTFAPDLVNAALDLLIDGERGVWHLANRGEISYAEFAGLLLQGRPSAKLPCTGSATPLSNLSLTSVRGDILPSLDDALARFLGPDHRALSEEPVQVAAE
jgi:dTDP-4-dehydrorhamnose reductase